MTDGVQKVEDKIEGEHRAFERGYACAVAMMLRGLSERECLGVINLDAEDIEQLGLDDYDLEPLRAFFARGG